MEIIHQAVEKNRTRILEAERYIWNHPETGYREVKTSAYMAQQFRDLGYDLVMAEGITGFYTVLDTGRPGPEVLIMSELDSIICAAHKEADPTTGAVHSCGHNAQCAALLGIAAALKEPGILEELCGRIRLCAVPAEELLEIEYRSRLKAEGKIKYMGGKSEFLYRGYFDGVDLALMVHTASSAHTKLGSNGCIAKKITYKGVAAHAGSSPWSGRNALYAANCGLNAINAIRETFIDSNTIRVHPIITSGGAMVNAIPETVTLESYVRGKTYDAIADANRRVNRALTGAALSLGTNIEIEDIPGYAPLVNDPLMNQMAVEAYALSFQGEELTFENSYSSGSTDMGELSGIMPVVQPYCGGSAGQVHGSDYQIADPEQACVRSAIWQLVMLKLLLAENGERAKQILAAYQPLFQSKEAYFDYVEQLSTNGDRIVYHNDGTATVRAE